MAIYLPVQKTSNWMTGLGQGIQNMAPGLSQGLANIAINRLMPQDMATMGLIGQAQRNGGFLPPVEGQQPAAGGPGAPVQGRSVNDLVQNLQIPANRRMVMGQQAKGMFPTGLERAQEEAYWALAHERANGMPTKSETVGGKIRQLEYRKQAASQGQGEWTPQDEQFLKQLYLSGGTNINIGGMGDAAKNQQQANILDLAGRLSRSARWDADDAATIMLREAPKRWWKLGTKNLTWGTLLDTYKAYQTATNYDKQDPAKQEELDDIWDSKIDYFNRVGYIDEQGANHGTKELDWRPNDPELQRLRSIGGRQPTVPPSILKDSVPAGEWNKLKEGQKKDIIDRLVEDPNDLGDILRTMQDNGMNVTVPMAQ